MIAPGTVPIWWEALGPDEVEPVLLVMGQGADALAWDDEFCSAVGSGGRRVIRFDNRDAGLSGDSDTPDYTISDMAGDAVRVLDTAGVDAAHLVGQSMGGMVAQEMAIDSPERVMSLALLSTSADLSIEPPRPDIARIAARLRVETEADWVEAAVQSIRAQTGPLWQFEEDLVRSRIEAAVARAFRPQAGMRQIAAVLRSAPRLDAMREVAVPTLILHGSADPILPVSHAHALADAMPRARLVVIEGMGHAVPWGHWDVVLGPLLAHLSERFAGPHGDAQPARSPPLTS